MNIASLELCRELYELSGWVPGRVSNGLWERGTIINSGHVLLLDHGDVPAYDLGFLLKKIPAGWFGKKSDDTYYATWKGEWNGTTSIKKTDRNSPEDAAAKLAIELFKQGILTK